MKIGIVYTLEEEEVPREVSFLVERLIPKVDMCSAALGSSSHELSRCRFDDLNVLDANIGRLDLLEKQLAALIDNVKDYRGILQGFVAVKTEQKKALELQQNNDL